MNACVTTALVRVSDRLWTFKRGQVEYQLTAVRPQHVRVRYRYPGEGWQVGDLVPHGGHALPTVRLVWSFIAGLIDRAQYKARLDDSRPVPAPYVPSDDTN